MIFSFLGLLGCASTGSIDSNSPEGLHKIGMELVEQERFEEALANFNELKNKHPYNNLATEAELQIANIYFLRENFVEAENAYKLFKEFHPKNPKIDFVTFRIAMSMYMQLPDSIDRDLNIAEDAKIYFRQVYTSYPSSDYAGSAKNHEKKCQLKLARKVQYIANFYFNIEQYDSALGRYEEVLVSYPKTRLIAESLYGATLSAHKLNNSEKAKVYYNELQKTYPDNPWTEKAKRALKW